MKKKEIIRNIALGTLPLCAVLFLPVWLISRSILAASVMASLLFIASLYSNIGRYFDDQKREKAGVTRHTFKTEKVYELNAPDDSVAPSLCFDIEENRRLLLNGQWIYEDNIYGDNAKEFYDAESDIFNRYTAPYSFPADAFEIWTSNLDGRPLRIVVSGDYIEPEQVSWPTPEKYLRKQFAVIDKNEIEKK